TMSRLKEILSFKIVIPVDCKTFLNILHVICHCAIPFSFLTVKKDGIREFLSQVLTWPIMSICKPIVAHTFRKRKMRMNWMTMLLIMDKEVLQEYHKLSIMPFNFRIEREYSRPYFMPRLNQEYVVDAW